MTWLLYLNERHMMRDNKIASQGPLMTFCLTPSVLLASSREHSIDFSVRDLIWGLDRGEIDRGRKGRAMTLQHQMCWTRAGVTAYFPPREYLVLVWCGEWKKWAERKEGRTLFSLMNSLLTDRMIHIDTIDYSLWLKLLLIQYTKKKSNMS